MIAVMHHRLAPLLLLLLAWSTGSRPSRTVEWRVFRGRASHFP